MSRTTDNKEELSEFKDDLISGWVKQGVRALPNANFEDEIMLKIQAETDYKKEVSTQLIKSLRFFLGALLSGIVLSIVILFGKIFSQDEIETLTILAIFVGGVVGIISIDNYRRLISKYAS